jgi:ATP-dependent Clp protease protease subunit
MKRPQNGIDFDEHRQMSPFDAILLECRYILLYDEISNESAKDVNTKLLGMNIKSSKAPIYLEINSPGGNVSDGIAILNTIQRISNPVITIINGEACSMAGFISVVGDKRFITHNSFWMGHPMQDIVGGTPRTIKDRGVYLEKLETDLQKIFKTKTKLNDLEFQKMMHGELWLDSEIALKKGIVDAILESPISLRKRQSARRRKK